MKTHPTYLRGDGITLSCGSDREAYTVVNVAPRRMAVQRDKATLLNGPNSGETDALVFTPGGFAAHVTGQQRYSYAPDPCGVVVTLTLRKNGKWVRKGTPMRSTAAGAVVPGRHEHYDYNF